jgi:hypothetical protein
MSPINSKNNGKLTVLDAENAWFIRVDSITDYGDEPFLEKLTIKPKEPCYCLNIKSIPIVLHLFGTILKIVRVKGAQTRGLLCQGILCQI